MALAIFDLDNTLLAGDSDYQWGGFAVEKGLVDAREYKERNKYFHRQYQQGTLDIYEYLSFCVKPLTRFSLDELARLHSCFMQERIAPLILPKGLELLKWHRQRGDYLMIITATSQFITEPIAARLDVDTLLAIDLEIQDNRYTGQVTGTPTFREGKVIRLNNWLDQHPEHSLEGSYFYSDSKNDLPLLQLVSTPVAVDPDPELRQVAENSGWQIISLR